MGIGLGFVISYAVAARVTRPVEQLASAARAVSAGDWNVRLDDVTASGEIGDLTRAFQRMTAELVDQRERLIQAERVAAWRELARRLAHELKNPLFPLRLTLDNLRRASQLPPDQFREVFDESLATLGGGLANLNTIVGRFSDFARMPAPEVGLSAPNDVIREVVQLFRAQFQAPDRPSIEIDLDLGADLGSIPGDPEQLRRAVQNLVLNAIDAMPLGGRLSIATRKADGVARIDVSDTGQGLSDEERRRLFTPYYTTKEHGTGLGLAIVQAIVSDHGGKIWATSEPKRGTAFHIELPLQDHVAKSRAKS